jgi:N-acetylglucosaminyldiphosphoundecaprenol N-acetyl-beta-D-mannosaminyltransferase
MSAGKLAPERQTQYRNILGVKFFIGDAPEAVEKGARGGLMVAPAAPALVDMEWDEHYREALSEADLVITDSGLLVVLWNAFTSDRVHRVSGLEYLKLLLKRPEFRKPGETLWVMPSRESMQRNLSWLKSQGYAVEEDDCYLAPKYAPGPISDESLLRKAREMRPRHIIVCIGGGVQEKLGLFLKRGCDFLPAIHCTGAALGFFSGDQVRIPDWADRYILGWFFRCLWKPARFVPRYARAIQLPYMMWRHEQRAAE